MTKPTLRRVATDFAGYGCILGAILFGWLPGPGGIPLLITGLGLLAVYNPWAKKILHYVRRHSENFRDILFPDNKLAQWCWDAVVVLMIAGATYLSFKTTGILWHGLGITLYALSSTTFFFNRHRLSWLEKLITKNKA